MPTPNSSTKRRLSPFTLLAVTALAISNLMVGILQANTWLVAASSVISAAFAFVYAVRSGMISTKWIDHIWPSAAQRVEADLNATPSKRFPLWMFLGLIFVMMPAVLLFLQTTGALSPVIAN